MARAKNKKLECSATDLNKLIQRSVEAGLYATEEEAHKFVLSDMKPKIERMDAFDRTVACQSLQQQLADIQFKALLDMSGFIYLPHLNDATNDNSANIDAVMLVNGPKRKGVLIGPAGRTADFTIRRNERWVIFRRPYGNQVIESEIKQMANLLRTSIKRIRNAADFAARSCFPNNDLWTRFGSVKIKDLDPSIYDKIRNTTYLKLITQPAQNG